MAHIIRISLIVLATVYSFSTNTIFAQNDCKVLLDKIGSQYTGDCKKGLAEGAGSAQGEDKYEGEFKKGLPNGSGVYTFGNGDVYTGEFKKGLKDGKGKMMIKLGGDQTREQVGFWIDDKYIGEHENPFEIQYKSADVLSVRISETKNPANDGNALFIELQHKGRVQSSPDFGINVTSGSFSSRYQMGTSAKIIISRFPLGFSLSYMGETVELKFYQETSWNVKIDFNK
ncbi:MAG: hypothetical protein IPL46_19320 [Saprospiraceae bacterium]|nr:hypothetical protein [Saprospiraceae bacterium]